MTTIFDTTLRDGAQAEGIDFSLSDKVKIARLIESLGIPYIEGGNPAANPKDRELFALQEREPFLTTAQLVAFGATIRVGERAEEDAGLRLLAQSRAGQAVSLFGKTSLVHVRTVLRCSPEENLRLIGDSVRYLTRAGKTVFFDAEHYFDGFGEDKQYALACLDAAVRAGASVLTLCDTNGGAMPEAVGRVVAETKARFPGVALAIHCHNDCGLAVANTLAAWKAGAEQMQGTMGGIGERCGNTNLCTLLPDLQLKLHCPVITPDAMTQLTSVSRSIFEIMNLAPDQRAPFIGHAAFAHKGGMHIDGVMKNSATFEHIDPETVGNHRRFLLSEQSGRAGMTARIQKLMPELPPDSQLMGDLLAQLKKKESKGYAYENADASFALLAMDVLGTRRHNFDVLDFHVLCSQPQNDRSAQAYIKLAVNGREEINAAEGDGPVNALDKALRKALTVFYPCVSDMRLADFKVRVLDQGGTASTVRVSIESTNGVRVWNTVGVSTNIIKACFKALCDAVDYLLFISESSSEKDKKFFSGMQ